MACRSTRAVSADLLFDASTRCTCFASSAPPNHRICPSSTLVRILAGLSSLCWTASSAAKNWGRGRCLENKSAFTRTRLIGRWLVNFSTLSHIGKISRCGSPSQLRSVSSNQRARDFWSISRPSDVLYLDTRLSTVYPDAKADFREISQSPKESRRSMNINGREAECIRPITHPSRFLLQSTHLNTELSILSY